MLAGSVGGGVPSSSAFSANRNNVNQTIADATFTKLKLTTEIFDTNGDFEHDADDSGGATESRFTPTIAGKYTLIATTYWTGNVTGLRLLTIYKNGTEVKRIQKDPSHGANFNITMSDLVEANGTTDYFEIFVYQNSGGDLVLNGAISRTYFSGAKES